MGNHKINGKEGQAKGLDIPKDQMMNNFTNLEGVPNIVKTNVFVIQKYIERPLLIKKRKFDIRLWVLIAHDMKCYLFKEGYIRTSSKYYDLSSSFQDDPFVHLTNNAVQKLNENYGSYEEGNQLSFKQAQKMLKLEGRDCNFHHIIQQDIIPIIQLSLKSVGTKLNPNQRKFCFEIFGYDFIIDDSLRPWLIEVNTNPCLEEYSTLLKQLIPRMIDDAFKLTLDLIFPKKIKEPIVIQQPCVEEEISIEIGSEPGIGSKGPKLVQDQGRAPSIKVQIESDNEEKQIQSSLENQRKNEERTKFSVNDYSDFDNMWEFIYQVKG